MQQPLVLPDGPVASYAAHLDRREGDALARAASLGREAIIDLVDAADLRGRGGAWFPTAMKWRTTLAHTPKGVAPILVVNAAEGEPGSFKDRRLLLLDPYSVIEGAAIAAKAVGATTVVVATKARFAAQTRRLREAITEMEWATRRAGAEPLPHIEIVEGPNRYLFGEESALLEVVAGRPPFPRLSPPWRHGALDLDGRGEPASTALAGEGSDDTLPPPAVVQNVETVARVAHIVRNPLTYGDAGQTFLATISGAGVPARVEEVPIGASLRDLLGGDAESIGLVLNGVSHPLVPTSRFDLPLLGGGSTQPHITIGAGAFQCFDTSIDPRAVAAAVARFLAVESCGQCVPCKSEGLAISAALGRTDADPGSGRRSLALADELAVRSERVVIGARCGLAAQQRDLLDGLLAHFPESLVRPIGDRSNVRVEPMSAIENGEVVYDESHEAVQPDWTRRAEWSGTYPAARVDVAQEKSA